MRLSQLGKLIAGSILAASLALAGPPAQAQTKPKVSFVYVGPIGDHGWSYQHHQGLQAIKKEFGDKIDSNFVENVPEGPDAERVIERVSGVEVAGHTLALERAGT